MTVEDFIRERDNKVRLMRQCRLNKQFFRKYQYAFVFDHDIAFGLSLCGAPRKEGFWVSMVPSVSDAATLRLMFHHGEQTALSEAQRACLTLDLDAADRHVFRGTLPTLLVVHSKAINVYLIYLPQVVVTAIPTKVWSASPDSVYLPKW